MFVIAYGSPVGGFKLHGPFDSEEAALDWGEAMGEGGEWPMEVHPVTEDSCRALYPWPYPVLVPDLGRMAELARPLDEDDYASERQVAAENAFFQACMATGLPEFKEGSDYYAWCLKATTEEMVDGAVAILKRKGLL